LLLYPGACLADTKNVHLNVEVVPKAPTDTINDFDFSSVNKISVDNGIENEGGVKGVVTSAKSGNDKGVLAAIAISMLGLILILVFGLNIRKKPVPAPSLDRALTEKF
jgi:hypothetical protein